MDTWIADWIDRHFLELVPLQSHACPTQAQCHVLFGHGLPERSPLPAWDKAPREQVRIMGKGGQVCALPVFGAARKKAYIALSPEEMGKAGLSAGEKAVISGHMGQVTVMNGLTALRSHIRVDPDSAKRLRLRDGQTVRVQTLTKNPTEFAQIPVYVLPQTLPAICLSREDGVACGFEKGDMGRIIG